MDERSERSFGCDFGRPHQNDRFPHEKRQEDQFDNLTDCVHRAERRQTETNEIRKL